MRLKIFLFGALLLVLITSGCNNPAPWPKFAANNRNNGLATCCGYSEYDRSQIRCTFPTNGLIRSSPAIGADGTIYFGSDDGGVYAIDPSCKQRWRFDAKGPVESSPALSSDGKLYVGIQSGVVALRTADGAQVWSASIGPVGLSSPVIGDHNVVIGSSQSIFALDPANGAIKWSANTLLPGFEVSSPAIGPNGLVYFSNRNFIYAFTEDGGGNPGGEKRWERILPFTLASPSVGVDGTVYIGSDRGELNALDGNNGSTVWQFVPRDSATTPGGDYTFGSAAVIFSGGKDLLFVTDGKFIYRIDAKTHHVDWSQSCASLSRFAPAVVREGPIFIGNVTALVIMRSDNKKPINFVKLNNDQPTSSPGIGADGTIYIGAGKTLYAVR